jgi:mevalonate kinase
MILFGEHAVVYGRPALAAPVDQVKARAVIMPDPLGKPGAVLVQAPNIGLEKTLDELPPAHPLAVAIYGVKEALGLNRFPACVARITSTIPVASGLGSGAAVSVALIRSLSAFLGRPLPDERVCALAYEVEKLHHGTPSGIDNTVITYAVPVFFIRDRPIERLQVARPFTVVIGDTGIPSPTAAAVGDLRRAWEGDRPHYERLFDAAGEAALAARRALEAGQLEALGSLMDENHQLLQQMGVSSPELDRLVEAARRAGAQGAKLSGGGRGGNMLALVEPSRAEAVARALEEAGALRTIVTQVARA